jgi:heme/copper-type cytochrome/quinol oxidase subunit 1
MGAVFALFSGFYYWFRDITGFSYIEQLGQIHFWSSIFGVNLTFFPMHFLGLAGMPRRIPDYPDAFAPFNYIATIGAIISLVSTLFFFFIFYLEITKTSRKQFTKFLNNFNPFINMLNKIWFNFLNKFQK